MRLVIFGLTVSSSWGNGHATLWRGLIRALEDAGHQVTFFERDVPYYAENRDLPALPGTARLVLYPAWLDVCARARQACRDADAVVITSFCPDAIQAAELAHQAAARTCFYDLDTPVTLARLHAGQPVPYLPANGLADFDLVLSYTGGAALHALRTHLGARRAEPLYGWADPALHRRSLPVPHYEADLSYLGTYAPDRQPALAALLVEPARARPDARFVIGGAQYPGDFPWAENIHFVRHLPPAEHPAFFSSSRLTLNVTRAAMAEMGWCPSGRLFEAALCGTPILTDTWPGLRDFFEPGREILTAATTEEALAAIDTPRETLARIARNARARVLEQHTARHRAERLIELVGCDAPRHCTTPRNHEEISPCGA